MRRKKAVRIIAVSFVAVLCLFAILLFVHQWRAYSLKPIHENLHTDKRLVADELTVATFNILHGCGSVDRGNRSAWFFLSCEKNLEAVASAILSMDADIIGLQEVDAGQARTLAEMTDLNYSWVPHDGVGYGFRWGNALLTRTPIQSTEVFPIGGTFARSRTAVRAELLIADTPLTVLSIHTDHRQVDDGAVRKILEEVEPSEGAAILIGDFNMPPTDDRIAMITGLGGFVDTAKAAGQGALVTYSGLGRIDYVFASGVRFKTEKAYLLEAQYHDASDHLAYVTTLRFLR